MLLLSILFVSFLISQTVEYASFCSSLMNFSLKFFIHGNVFCTYILFTYLLAIKWFQHENMHRKYFLRLQKRTLCSKNTNKYFFCLSTQILTNFQMKITHLMCHVLLKYINIINIPINTKRTRFYEIKRKIYVYSCKWFFITIRMNCYKHA